MYFIFRGNELWVHETAWELSDVSACATLNLQLKTLPQVWRYDPSIRTTHMLLSSAAPPDYTFRTLRALLSELGDGTAWAGGAFQIVEWACTHRYWGVCAHPMEAAGHDLCMGCLSCGMSAYPRISPAMMVLVRQSDSIVLARHATYATARPTARIEFVDGGESIAGAIQRKGYEEIRLRVTDLRYFGSQSWPFPHSLLIAFTADSLQGQIRLQADEVAGAHWYGLVDAWPTIPTLDSVANHLVRANLPPDIAFS